MGYESACWAFAHHHPRPAHAPRFWGPTDAAGARPNVRPDASRQGAQQGKNAAARGQGAQRSSRPTGHDATAPWSAMARSRSSQSGSWPPSHAWRVRRSDTQEDGDCLLCTPKHVGWESQRRGGGAVGADPVEGHLVMVPVRLQSLCYIWACRLQVDLSWAKRGKGVVCSS